MVALVPVLAACSSGPDSTSSDDTSGPPTAQGIKHGPFFPECGGVTDQTMAEQTRVSGLVNTAKNSVGCQWLAGGGILGPHFSITLYRGSPIGRERKTEELSRASVEDINIEGHDGFIALGEDVLGEDLALFEQVRILLLGVVVARHVTGSCLGRRTLDGPRATHQHRHRGKHSDQSRADPAHRTGHFAFTIV